MTKPNKPYDNIPFNMGGGHMQLLFPGYYVDYYIGTLPQFLGLFNCLYLTQFSTDFSQILDSKSYDQA